MLGVTTAIIHDTRVQKQDGTYAIKLRITYNRQQKYFSTGKYLSIEDWKQMQSKNKRKQLKELNIFLSTIEAKAVKIIDMMDSFSFEEFQEKFNTKPKNSLSVLEALKSRQSELKENNQISTAITYEYTRKTIEDFIKSKKKKNLKFREITPTWLESYEKWMTENGKSITTVGMYLRNLKAIVNQAIEKGILPQTSYPFSKNKYKIPTGRNIKKALTIKEIKQLFEFKTRSDAEARALDIWLFSYLCNGINMKDIARLKNKNLGKKHITFIRAKTERSSKANLKPISIVRIPQIDKIISKWGDKSNDPDAYVFPILTHGDTPEIEYDKIKQAIKTQNKYTKRIAEELNLDQKLTTYSARHSFATVLKRSGAPIEYISESLGHSSFKTTQSYLDSFEDDTKESFQRKLVDFD